MRPLLSLSDLRRASRRCVDAFDFASVCSAHAACDCDASYHVSVCVSRLGAVRARRSRDCPSDPRVRDRAQACRGVRARTTCQCRMLQTFGGMRAALRDPFRLSLARQGPPVPARLDLTSTKIEDEPETRLVIKTTADRLTALHDAIRSAHPYETPQLLIQTVCPRATRVPDACPGRERHVGLPRVASCIDSPSLTSELRPLCTSRRRASPVSNPAVTGSRRGNGTTRKKSLCSLSIPSCPR